jgi:hypothetical protein
VIDPLLEGLQTAGIQAKTTEEHCGSAAAPPPTAGSDADKGDKKDSEAPSQWWGPRGAEWIPVLLLLAAIAMAFRPSRKKASPGNFKQQPLPEPAKYAPLIAPLAPTVPGEKLTRPALHGLTGQYAGKSFSLDAGPSLLGRDQRAANLVFAPDADSISKRHCMVSWDAPRGKFVIQDLGSTNGTFLATGERLTPGQAHDLPPGARFFVGDPRNQFEVRLD